MASWAARRRSDRPFAPQMQPRGRCRMQQCSRRARRAAIAICAVAILIVRKQDHKPDDYQRLRWVLWGCLIGLPSFLLAELASESTTFEAALGFTPSDDIIGLLYLVNGVLCLFVFEAVPSERVVSVWIPIRRVTILAFILTAPARSNSPFRLGLGLGSRC